MRQVPELFDIDAFIEKMNDEVADIQKDTPVDDPPEQQFHHNTCKNSRCTTCANTMTCEVYSDLCSMAMDGFQNCMAECLLYEPIRYRKNSPPRPKEDQQGERI